MNKANKSTLFRTLRIILATVVVTGSYPLPAYSAAPVEMNYQGKLADTSGNPLSGPHNVRFRIFDNSSGTGTALYDSTYNNLSVTNGVFSVVLGQAPLAALPASVFQGTGSESRWLQISVNGTDLTPLQKLVAAPYALSVAQDAVGTLELANNAVSTAKIPDGAVTSVKIEGDPAVAGTLNLGTNPVDWTKLKGVPSGFADGIDSGGLTVQKDGASDISASTMNFLGAPFSVVNNAGVADIRLDASSVTLQGNTFNTANSLLRLNGSGLAGLNLGGTGADFSGAPLGSVFYKSVSSMTALAPGSDGLVLKLQGGVPIWDTDLSGGAGTVTTSGGNTNYLSKWTGGTSLGNSLIFDDGVLVGIGTSAPGYVLDVAGDLNATQLCIGGSCQSSWPSTSQWLDSVTPTGVYYSLGNVGIGGLPSSTASLNVVGNMEITGTMDGYDVSVSGLNWDTGYSERREWDGGSTNLNASTGRTSLGLGALATLAEVAGGTAGTITDATITNADLASGSFTQITGVGTLNAGTWNASAIGAQYGGTGQDWSTIALGHLPYFSNTGTLSTLAPASDGQVLTLSGGVPTWSSGAANLVTGAGNQGRLAYWVGTSSIAANSSLLYDANGNVGIGGATMPQQRLHVHNVSGGATDGIRISADRPVVRLEETDANPNENYQLDVDNGALRLSSNDDAFATPQTRLILQQTGNLGVGTTSPNSRLHVAGEAFVTSSVTASGFFGDGGNLTNLNATSVAQGTLAVARGGTGAGTAQLARANLNVPVSTTTFNPGFGMLGGGDLSADRSFSLNISTTAVDCTSSSAGGKVWWDTSTAQLVCGADAAGGGGISGTTTQTGALTKWSAVSSIVDSQVYDTAVNVGIGTTSPQYKLDVQGSLGSLNAAHLATASGNVGIGTTNPNSKLHVAGELNVTSSATATGFFGSGLNLTNLNASNINSGALAMARGGTGTDVSGFGNGNLVYKTSTGLGDVGTGATGTVLIGNGTGNAPSWTAASGLSVGSASTAGALAANGSNCSAGNYPLGVDAAGNTETCTADDDTPDSDSEVPDAVSINNTRFYAPNGAGNVGISTTNPQFGLEVNGTARVNNNLTVGDGSGADTLGFGSTALLTLPITTPGAGQLSYISNTLQYHNGTAVQTVATTGNAFLQGGNSFGAVGQVGANDAFGLALRTNNAERLRIDTAGNVGIGNSTPSVKLDVTGAVIASSAAFTTAAGTGLTVTNNVMLATNGTGNVGIGSTAAAYRLDVNGTLRAQNSAHFATSSGSVVIGTTTATAKLNVWGTGSTFALHVSTDANPATPAGSLVVLNNGNVGIGTTVPSGRLSIWGQGSTYALHVSTNSNGSAGSLTVLNNGNVGIGTTAPAGKLTVWGQGSTYALHVSTNPNGSNGSLVMLNSGNVGIGTTGPATRLHLEGAAQTPPTSGTTSRAISRVRAANTNVVLETGILPASPWSVWQQVSDSTDLSATYPLVLQPNGGSVGIGTTNPVQRLHIYTSATGGSGINTFPQLLVEASNNHAIIDLKSNDDGTTVKEAGIGFYNNGAFQSEVYSKGGDGILRFYTGGEDRMVLDSVGRVGLGTSAPSYAFHIIDPSDTSTTAYISKTSGDSGSNALRVSNTAEMAENWAIDGRAVSTGNGDTNYGVYGHAQGDNGIMYGIYGRAIGDGGTNYGVYGRASGTGTNWAGYFSSGNVYIANNTGIGTTAPVAPLHVDASADDTYVARFYNTDGTGSPDGIYIRINDDVFSTGNDFMVFSADGTTVGSIDSDGGTDVRYNTTSDARLKENVKGYEGALDTLMRIRPVTYNFIRSPGRKTVGFLAQDLMKVYPYAVSGDPNSDPNEDPMSVDYSKLTPLLTGAVQELKAQVEALKKIVCMDHPESEYCKQ